MDGSGRQGTPLCGNVLGQGFTRDQSQSQPWSQPHVPMNVFRVPTVLRRVPSAVPPTVVG